MIAASAAVRAHHVREAEKHSREEALRRSQLIHDGDGEALQAAQEPYKPLAEHYLLVPFKDCDSEVQDGQVSSDEITCLSNLGIAPEALDYKINLAHKHSKPISGRLDFQPGCC